MFLLQLWQEMWMEESTEQYKKTKFSKKVIPNAVIN